VPDPPKDEEFDVVHEIREGGKAKDMERSARMSLIGHNLSNNTFTFWSRRVRSGEPKIDARP
jgi:hypothetical protein